MVKRITIGFAVAGFLVPICWYKLNFATFHSLFYLSYFLMGIGVDWPVDEISSNWTAQLILLAFISTVIFGSIGWVVSRACRRLPKGVQDPHSRKFVKRFIFYFAAVGYVLPIWFFAFQFYPFHSGLPAFMLYISCSVCWGGAGGIGPFIEILWSACPINAVYLGLIGWAVGRAFRRLPPPLVIPIKVEAEGQRV